MSDIAIKASNLSKLYRIGQFVGYRTLRDSLTNKLMLPVRMMKHQPAKRSEKNSVWALKDVSFEIKEGEAVGIIGRNGAGKSTLLKVLTRITEPTEGYAEIRGRVGSLLEVGTGFHPELTGRENIYLNGAVLGMKKKEIDRKFDEMVAFSGVEKFIDTPLKRYSSGMQVRLAFAVAAHLEPEILLVDEVLAVGDSEFQKKCLGKMGELTGGGRTVLFVSHNISSILELCTKAILLESGSVIRQGITRDVVSEYLQDNNIPFGEAEYNVFDGRDMVELLRVYVMDDTHCIRPDIPHDKPFFVSIDYNMKSSVDNMRIGIRLFNERNIAILHSATSDANKYLTIGSIGRHRCFVKIPGEMLSPGRYFVELGIWSPSVGHHHHIQESISFEIGKSDIDSIGDEVLRPTLEWRIE